MSYNRKQIMIVVFLAMAMIGLFFVISNAFEEITGYNIAIVSFAATVVIIVLNPLSNAAKPRTIISSYMIAASIGAIISALPWEGIGIKSTIGMGIIITLLIALKVMHTPAVVYFFGFVLEGYGFTEFILTIPTLLGFFIAFSLIIFIVEEIAKWTGIIKVKQKKYSHLSFYEKVEKAVDNIIPYALIILFIIILLEFLYPVELAPYSLYLIVIDGAIIALFVVDLVFKYIRIKSIPNFFKKYYLEIIAVIPFFVVFRLFEGAAGAMRLMSRGAIEFSVHTPSILQLLRPLARFPRFAKMLHYLEDFSGDMKKIKNND